jgi:hypothetical protein
MVDGVSEVELYNSNLAFGVNCLDFSFSILHLFLIPRNNHNIELSLCKFLAHSEPDAIGPTSHNRPRVTAVPLGQMLCRSFLPEDSLHKSVYEF